jgi:hypothetical protein
MTADNLKTGVEEKFDGFLDGFSFKVLLALWCSAFLLYIWGPEKVVMRFSFLNSSLLLEDHSHLFLYPAIASALMYFINRTTGIILGSTTSTVAIGQKEILHHKYIRRSFRSLNLALPFIGFITQAGSLLYSFGFNNQLSWFVVIALIIAFIPFVYYIVKSIRYL